MPNLIIEISLYVNGALRFAIDELKNTFQRFRYTDYDRGATLNRELERISLEKVIDFTETGFTLGEYGKDTKYEVHYSPFRVIQKVKGEQTLIVNEGDTMFFEKSINQVESQGEQPSSFAQSRFTAKQRDIQYEVNQVAKTPQNFMLGVVFSASYLYGLPERSVKLLLNDTLNTEPYRLYALDVFPHKEWKPQSLYSGIPYITGHTEANDASLFLANPSDTYVDIFPVKDSRGKFVSISQESGILEMVLFASETPKSNMKKLCELTGFPMLPQWNSIGFHYSKWEQFASSDRILDYNKNFNLNNIPVDVFWMDIPATDGNRYFTFNTVNFTEYKLNVLKSQMILNQRQLVIITDPHIKKDEEYSVWQKGDEFDLTVDSNDQITNIFVKNSSLQPFIGYSWPGDSQWIDYFNEGACQYWGSLYQYDSFKGTSRIFGIWTDMNEPSVFNQYEGTMPKNNVHIMSDGSVVLHRNVHNAYGLMMSKATYEGLIKRDAEKLRPFALTRSVFLGSQKYAAKWTGDNQATFDELGVSINQILSLGLSGITFTGADIPGFAGSPTDDLFIAFYQLGAFYPFMRAHGHIDYEHREPYLQSQRVQTVIRESINMRYDFSHYLYGLFYEAHTQGIPIMRPLWFEFPQDRDTFDISEIFMWGSSILVAPKVNQPLNEGLWETQVYLPPQIGWYNYQSKLKATQLGHFKSALEDSDIEIYIKEGSIIPIKLHEGRLSLLEAKDDPIRLEIYLDPHGYAKGTLYLDDGSSFNYKESDQFTLVTFVYSHNKLSYQFENKSMQNSLRITSLSIIDSNGVKEQQVNMDIVQSGSV
ncbi:hypothetical protein FGO68_gene5628 [Halteria grandinella]|uniref:Glycoside hydrolase family 31 N-terminal domain-containing protein n=1 Tax=Halteria grandinella TaxID=5974 RepID=A0A8J8T7N0_HALGN|nr:hypothetical protein FGO68_gene5628 [Halteria grandinella]